MNFKDLKNKNIPELKLELIKILNKQFNVRFQIKNSQLQQTHLLKIFRHTIAYIKMLITEKEEGFNEKKSTYGSRKNIKK